MTGLRTFAHARVLTLTEELVDYAIGLLASALLLRFGQPHAIIGIANGGIIPADKLAAQLTTDCYRVTARHNATDDIFTQATGHVSVDVRPLSTVLDGRRLHGPVVLVDDICGTGATVNALCPALRPLLAGDAQLLAVALCLNQGSPHRPDLWAWTVSDWVRFPWEGELPLDQPQESLPFPTRVQP